MNDITRGYIRSRARKAMGMTAIAGAGAASLMMLAATSVAAAEAPAAPAATADQDNLVTSVTITKKTGKQSENLKATAPLLDTPQTRQIISAELMQERGATTLTEALQNSPGVGTFFLGENGTTSTGDAIYMRGNDVSGSIMIDGVRNVGSVFRDIFNIEQVEVLKGGAGGEIGRSAATGAINMYTKQPGTREIKSGSVSYGSADFKRATADVNFLVNPTTAVRINLVGQDGGVAGRDEVKNKRWGVAPSVAFGLGTSTRYFVDYMHITQNNVPDGGVFTLGLPGYTSPDPTNRPWLSNVTPVDSSNFYGTKDDHDKVHVDTAAFILEHDFTDDITIRNLTRWTTTDQEYQLSSFLGSSANLATPSQSNPAGWTIAARSINNKNVTNDALYNGTNLRAKFSTGPFSHTVAAGVEFIRERQKARLYTGTGAYPAFSVYDPTPNVTGYTRVLNGGYTLGQTDTIGVYFNDNIALTQRLFLNGGLRLDSYDTKYDSVAATGVVAPRIKASDDLVSGNVGLVFKPTEDGSVYVSYANTKQPPGGANFQLAAENTANANSPNVEPQTAKNYEVGTKWNVFGDKLLLTAALYKTEYSDQILQDSDGTFYRAGAKKVRGVELGATGQITKEWSVNAGYSTQHTKVESPTNTVPTADGSAVLTYNPSSSFTVWSTYRLPAGLTFGGGARYNGEMKRGSDGAVGTPKYVESYWVFDGLVAYRIKTGVELQLNVYNLFDKDYAASINKSGYRYTPGVPRSAKLALNVSF